MKKWAKTQSAKYIMVFNNQSLPYVKIQMWFDTCKITYVFLQRFFTTSFYICKFTYDMCFYNVFLHMVCIFTTFFYIPYVFLQRFLATRWLFNDNACHLQKLHMYFYICIFTYVISHMLFYVRKKAMFKNRARNTWFYYKNQKSSYVE